MEASELRRLSETIIVNLRLDEDEYAVTAEVDGNKCVWRCNVGVSSALLTILEDYKYVSKDPNFVLKERSDVKG